MCRRAVKHQHNQIMMAAMMRQNRDRRQQDAELFLISLCARRKSSVAKKPDIHPKIKWYKTFQKMKPSRFQILSW